MIYLLCVLILVLAVLIVFIYADFRKAKVAHDQKVAELNETIVVLMASNDTQRHRLMLSDELRDKLREARAAVDTDIFAIHFDFVEKLSENKLLE